LQWFLSLFIISLGCCLCLIKEVCREKSFSGSESKITLLLRFRREHTSKTRKKPAWTIIEKTFHCQTPSGAGAALAATRKYQERTNLAIAEVAMHLLFYIQKSLNPPLKSVNTVAGYAPAFFLQTLNASIKVAAADKSIFSQLMNHKRIFYMSEYTYFSI